jgi:hypothetical protein
MLGEQIGEEKGKVTGQRVLDISEDGNGIPKIETFTAYGIGRFTSPGKIRFYGSVYYRTTSNGKVAFLNNVVGLFEHDSDEQGNASSKIWEWK